MQGSQDGGGSVVPIEFCSKRDWQVHCPCWGKSVGVCCACGADRTHDLVFRALDNMIDNEYQELHASPLLMAVDLCTHDADLEKFYPFELEIDVESWLVERRMLTYYRDSMRHLVCRPYSVNLLHHMAADLDIKRCWFHGKHRRHYDIPKKKMIEVAGRSTLVMPRDILAIIKAGEWRPGPW